MKKVLVFCLAFILMMPLIGVNSVAFGETVADNYLEDSFGATPKARTMTKDMERVRLSSAHKPYTKYGYAARLKPSSVKREYLTYDIANVSEAEISLIANESMFAANHGWGVSLGVTDNITAMPLNNINRIDLNNISPIYLSETGRPYIYYAKDRRWMCYIAGGDKFSFAPSETNVGQKLRMFTVPQEVIGEYEQSVDGEGNLMVDGNGNPIMTKVKEGYLYPYVNLEYGVANGGETVWTPLHMTADNFKITSVKYLGGDHEYNQTIKITNIPQADKIRIGVDYTRQTLKPSALGDIEADVYEDFVKKPDESIFVHNVKLKLSEIYDGGFEDADKTGISADISNVIRDFGYGEDFVSAGLKIKDIMNSEYEEVSDASFEVDSSSYNKYKAGFYSIAVISGAHTAKYNVEVYKPSKIQLNTDEVKKEFSSDEKLNSDKIIVTAITEIGSGKKKRIIEKVIPNENVTFDYSGVDMAKDGEYDVAVKIGTVSADYKVTISVVEEKKGGCGAVMDNKSNIVAFTFGILFITSAFVAIMAIRRKVKK